MFGTNPVLSALLALSLTLVLIWLAVWLLTTISPNVLPPGIMWRKTSSSSAMLTIESVTPIATRRKVVVLRYGEYRLAVLTGGTQDVFLGPLPPPPS